MDGVRDRRDAICGGTTMLQAVRVWCIGTGHIGTLAALNVALFAMGYQL